MKSKLVLVALLLMTSACGQNYNVHGNILVIGDSISLGWTPYATIKSSDRYSWHRLTPSPTSTWPENARNTNYTLRNVNQWLDWHPETNLVFWNNGVWNCTRYGYATPGEDTRNYGTTPAQYEAELIEIAKILKSRVPRVVFNTTTPCKGQNNNETDHNAEAFNEIAKRVLPPLGVEIVDLYAFTNGHDGTNGTNQWWISDTDVHFNSLGNELISDYILHYLDPSYPVPSIP